MTTERVGDITTTDEYWDCECEADYIRPKSQDLCTQCGCRSEEQPDSRLSEVLAAGLPVSRSRP